MSKKEKKELKKAFDELIKGVSNIEIVPIFYMGILNDEKITITGKTKYLN